MCRVKLGGIPYILEILKNCGVVLTVENPIKPWEHEQPDLNLALFSGVFRTLDTQAWNAIKRETFTVRNCITLKGEAARRAAVRSWQLPERQPRDWEERLASSIAAKGALLSTFQQTRRSCEW